MERTKLLFDREERSIGIVTKSVLENDEEIEKYLPVCLFNILVTGYISGPRTKFRGYRILIKFTSGEDRQVVINHKDVSSFSKFMDALMVATHSHPFSFGDFDESLWPDLFNRVYFHCIEKKICKILRPAENIGICYKYLEDIKEKNGFWTKKDYEEVYPDIVIGGDGEIKTDPVHIYVSEVMKKAPVKTSSFTPSGLEGFLEMLNPPFTSSNPELQERQVITLLANASLRYYRFIVDQIGACPTLILGSAEPSTMKTSTLLLCLKMTSDPGRFMAPGSSLASVDLMKTLSSHSVLLDDIEDLSVHHKIIMDGYNGACKSTIERGEEIKIAGQIMSFNITPKDCMQHKEDEGRTLLQLYKKLLNIEIDFDELFENQVEHQEAMKSKGAPHDFLVAFGAKYFCQEPGERSKWQEAHKEAMRILREKMPDFNIRKLSSYSQPITMFLLLEEEVENSNNDNCVQQWVRAVKDRRRFLETYCRELELGEEQIQEMLRKNPQCGGCPTCTCEEDRPKTAKETEANWDDVENTVELILDRAVDEEVKEADLKKVIMLHKEKSGIQNLSISHPRLENSFVKMTLKELKLPVKHWNITGPKSKTSVREDSVENKGSGNTIAAYCYQINIQHFNGDLKQKVLDVFKEKEIVAENDEDVELATQSQDFRGFSQNQAINMLFCKLCNLKVDSKTDLKIHQTKDHVKCKECKNLFINDEKLKEHVKEKHAEFYCDKCRKTFPKGAFEGTC